MAYGSSGGWYLRNIRNELELIEQHHHQSSDVTKSVCVDHEIILAPNYH